MKFTKTKNGYSEKEVDDYISSLKANYEKAIEEKNETIARLEEAVESVKYKEKSIAMALTAAVDKAKEIETSSKNIYRLKIEQMTILCSKWETLLNEMIRKYPGIEDITNVREDINNLKSVIKNALKDDFNIELMSKNPVTDPIRILLSRLNQAKANSNTEKQKVHISRKAKVSSSDKTELSKLEEKSNQIKPIVNLNLKKGDKYENLVDKFLNSDEEDLNAKLPKTVLKAVGSTEDKFDLNEAINPKEDLEEIMKAFDFYKKK
jgi:cell division septum initiation protein DivIVA